MEHTGILLGRASGADPTTRAQGGLALFDLAYCFGRIKIVEMPDPPTSSNIDLPVGNFINLNTMW